MSVRRSVCTEGKSLILAHCQNMPNGAEVKILAVVRVVKPEVGVGLEFLDIERDSHATLLAWIENLRKSR